MPAFRRFHIATAFSIDIPVEATTDIADDVATITLADESQIVASLHDLVREVVCEPVIERHLRDYVEGDIEQHEQLEDLAYAIPADLPEDGPVIVRQALMKIEAEPRWRLARLYGRRDGSQILLIHWTGSPATLTQIVLPAIVSVEIELWD